MQFQGSGVRNLTLGEIRVGGASLLRSRVSHIEIEGKSEEAIRVSPKYKPIIGNRSVFESHLVTQYCYKILLVALSLLPIVETINGVFISVYEISIIGSLYRFVIVLVSIIGIFSGRGAKRITLVNLMILLTVFYLPHLFEYCIDSEFLKNGIKIIVPIICIEFFRSHGITLRDESAHGVETILRCWTLLVPITILVPYLLGIGDASHGDGAGYKALYFAQNDLGVLVTVTYMYSFYILLKVPTIKRVLIWIACIVCVLILGLKSSYVISILASIWFLFKMPSLSVKAKLGLLIIGMFGLIVTCYLFEEVILNILTRMEYFYRNLDFYSFMSSSRIDRIDAFHKLVVQIGGTDWWIWGIGVDYYSFDYYGYTLVEMDPIDTIFIYGILSTFAIYAYYISFIVCQHNGFRNFASPALISVILISVFSGHVLTSAMSGIVISVVCAYSIQNSLTTASKRGIKKARKVIFHTIV